jgi:hypothetical protein
VCIAARTRRPPRDRLLACSRCPFRFAGQLSVASPQNAKLALFQTAINIPHMDSYFRFITTPEMEPTNNVAEQAIRFVAIHRRMTQGTRGQDGQRWCERIWTVVVTCAQQGRSVFNFLYEAVSAHFQGTPAPSLLPNSS